MRNIGKTLLALTIASFPLHSSQSATLLFKSNFGSGVVLNPPTNFLAATSGAGQAWQSITGVDSETGFDWSKKPLGAYFFGLQIITATPVDAVTINDQVYNTIRSVTGPDGKPVNELFQNLKYKPWIGATPTGMGAAQIPLLINRPWTIGDVQNLYISYWFKHQPDLVDRLDANISSGNWRAQFEFKTGGYNNTYAGDYRISTIILKGTDSKLYWSTKGDNVANGPWPRVDYWIERNTVIPVPVDKWFKFEVFWHRSTGADGRYWAAVDGQVIVDHLGPNMGDLNLPINRIFINNAYSGGSPEIQSQTTGLEIWDGFPCGEGVSCFAKADTTPPTVSITSPTSGTTVSGNVTVGVTATDNVSVSKVDFAVNGAAVANSVAAPYSFNWDSKTISNGSVGLSATAYDSNGNKATSSTVTVNVSNTVADTTAPVVSIVNPADGATLSGSVTISSTATDNSGAAGITQSLYIDGALKTTASGGNLSYSWNSKGRKTAKHIVSVTATDKAGNKSTKSITVYK